MTKTLADLKPGDEVAVFNRDGTLSKIEKITRATHSLDSFGVGVFNFAKASGCGWGRGIGMKIAVATEEHRQELAQREAERKAFPDARPERVNAWLSLKGREIEAAYKRGEPVEAIELLRAACEQFEHVE